MKAKSTPRAPAHLRPETRAWWISVVREFVLDAHHRMVLTTAATAWDRMAECREALAEHGLTFIDPKGVTKARPEAAIESSARAGFLKSLRELGLDIDGPAESARPPVIASARRA